MRWWFVLAWTFALLPFGAPADANDEDQLRDGEKVEETGLAYPGAEPQDAKGNDTIWCVRIVDAVDGRPIPAARVSVPWHPGWGPEEEQHFQCAGTADWDGWVRLPVVGLEGWDDYIIADAGGYAANEYCVPSDDRCELKRGVDVPVVVVDYMGQPVPNAHVALNLCCGHIPDQRSAVTDGKGQAVLHDILPSRDRDIWLKAPYAHRGTTRLRRTWRPGDPPVVIDAIPGMTTSGRILAADGTPVMHAVVGSADSHRPVTITDREGRYRLVGISAWDKLEYVLPPHLGQKGGTFFAPPEGVERVLRLGERTDGGVVAIRCIGPKREPARSVRVSLVRASDGLAVTAMADKQGHASFSVAPGRYQVLADGELGTFGRRKMTVDVTEDRMAVVEVEVPRNPTVNVNLSYVAGQTVGLTTKRGFRKITWDPIQRRTLDIPVPLDEPAMFRVSDSEEGDLLVSYAEVPKPGESVTLRWVPVKRVTARIVGPDGQPIPGVITLTRERWRLGREDVDDATLDPVADTRLVGTVSWTATPKDPALCEAFGDVRLPQGGETVALGDIHVVPARLPDLKLAFPADMLEEATVTCTWPGVRNDLTCDVRADGTLSPQYSAAWPAFVPGVRLDVQCGDESTLPIRHYIEGSPPWRITWPGATLTVSVLNAGERKPLTDAVLVVDGEVVGPAYVDGQPATLRAVTAGRHTLTVAERNHIGKTYTLVVRDGDARKLEVQLRPR